MKEADFVHQELADQVQAGHIIVFPMAAVCNLPKLWLSPVTAIPQVGRRPRIIFDLTWSGLNKATAQEAPEKGNAFWRHPPTHYTEGTLGEPMARPGIPREGRPRQRLHEDLGPP